MSFNDVFCSPEGATVDRRGLALTVALPGLNCINMLNTLQGFHSWLGTVSPPGLQIFFAFLTTVWSDSNRVGLARRGRAGVIAVMGKPSVRFSGRPGVLAIVSYLFIRKKD